ncbi:transcription antitermination factor NusB [Permianibacter aggregans]|uniref:Transcription antitermination protein NusB n=1 Tax=Permianibacter aggregans TaxID=1510150 RepID=A0A4R6UQA5_9GAMM|nr:transcription antitermination factor NusB [Permianibacter aggregans]QGX39109.1 transcription antitermination factor NusB [Permianibacter aggregans]TDQ47683.1 NusB antitermination factor [Permianibacter aggregans]
MSKPAQRRVARKYAVQAIYSWQLNHQPPQEIELNFLAENDFKGCDTAYFQELLRGVVDDLDALNDLLKPTMHLSLDEVDPVELAILRMAAYELKHRIDVPYKVVINEALEQAKTFGATDGHKFVNGVLDKLARQLRAIEIAAARTPR